MRFYFNQIFKVFSLIMLLSVGLQGRVSALMSTRLSLDIYGVLDTARQDTVDGQDTVLVYYNIEPTKLALGKDSVLINRAAKMPYTTLHQYMKGNVAGLYVQETSGEPGTIKQETLIRGLSHPILTAQDIHRNRPLIVLDGIALIDDPSIIYDIQDYTVQPVGAATSGQVIFDMDNIESIKVLKDYSTSGVLGPRAANGVIYVTTKNAAPGNRRISLNTYTGFAAPSSVTTINAEHEKRFRQPFYDKYATIGQLAAYPTYLSDSSNVNFYGPSNWTDLYYKTTPIYSVNGSLSGGSERSNFRFFGGHMSNAGAADDTKLKRYQGAFYINMLPTPWMTISSMLQMTRADRDRNRSLKERLGETRFFPDMSTPLSPSKDMYGLFLKEYDKVIDDNLTNSMVGRILINFAVLKNLNIAPRFSLDYNENKRNVFWPSTLMSGNNYVSNYQGFNERMSFGNVINYSYDHDANRSLFAELGFNYDSDMQKYNYGVGYRGPNDFIKVNTVEGNSQKADYLKAVGFIPYYYSDRIAQRLLSFYGRLTYTKNNQYKVAALFRRDGSSLVQSNSRWFNSYSFDGMYDFNYHLESDYVNKLQLTASYGRMGVIPESDRIAAGPQYDTGLGWEGNKAVFSYNGIGTVSRPYYSGWIGYDIPWEYNTLATIGLDIGVNNHFDFNASFYNKHNKDMVFSVPTVSESGYSYEMLNGMSVENKGVDFTFTANFPQTSVNGIGWNASLNVGYNTNKLTGLPRGMEEATIGRRKLEVGERIDRFWLLRNEGVFLNDQDVPVNPNNYELLNYNGGTVFKEGDPRWRDLNGDYEINDKDRELIGNMMPKYVGGLSGQFLYGKIDLSVQFYFNIGRDILNEQAAKYYDFVNTDESNHMGGVREITYWEKNFKDNTYPTYNPWSGVTPYQVEQDMFMEDGSFIKLRNLSLGYDFTSLVNTKTDKFKRFYGYVTANNIWTYTKYSGRDPELVDFFGYDTGAGIRLPKTFTVGVKLEF